MSLNHFIAEIWSGQILNALQKTLVYGALFNDDYQGDLTGKSLGDTVRINAFGTITVRSYAKDTAISAPEVLSDAQTTLTISQAKYYNFAIDDVDKAQQNPKVMGPAAAWAAYSVKDVMDQYFAGFYTDAPSANLIGSSSSFTTPDVPTYDKIGAGHNVYDYLVLLGQLLDQSLTPEQGRWAVIPPWGASFLKMDPRFTGYNTDAGRATIMSGKLDASGGQAEDGYVGMIDSMSVYKSVNAPHLGGTTGIAGSQDVFMAGHRIALTKAVGLNEVEAYRHPNYFSDAIKALTLYGAKTVRPAQLAVAYLQHP
jgi:hypothetical protein